MQYSAPFTDEDGDLVVLGSDGETYYFHADDAMEADRQGSALEWGAAMHEELLGLEHRLGRELTGAETERVWKDCASNGDLDVGDAYVAAFPNASGTMARDRTRDSDDRHELMAEVMEDATRTANEAEQGEAEAPDDE